MAIARWEPFSEVLPLRDAMNRLFEETLVPSTGLLGRASTITMDVYAEGDNYVVEVALPGLAPDAVNISALGNQVTISGELATLPQDRRYLIHERFGGRFERTVTLPSEVDAGKADAHYEHGLLRLTVPKAETAKPRRIALATGS